MVLFQRIQQCRSKAEIPRLEFGRVFRAIDSREIEYEICFCAVFVQLLCGAVDVVFVDFVNLYIRTRAILAVAYVLQILREISPDKALRACNQYVHVSFLHTILLTTPVYD